MSRVVRELARDRRLLFTAGAAAGVFALVTALAAVLIPNPLFQRMVPVRWWEVAVWAVATPLVGVAFALSRRPVCAAEGRTVAGGLAALLAVTCPTCNGLVVAAIGTAGALTYFGPVQPVIGVVGVVLLVGVVRYQLRRLDPAPQPVDADHR